MASLWSRLETSFQNDPHPQEWRPLLEKRTHFWMVLIYFFFIFFCCRIIFLTYRLTKLPAAVWENVSSLIKYLIDVL